MERFIPYEKLSKKEKRKLDAARRGSWGGLNPVTRKPANPKAYKRSKSWKREVPPFCDLLLSSSGITLRFMGKSAKLNTEEKGIRP